MQDRLIELDRFEIICNARANGFHKCLLQRPQPEEIIDIPIAISHEEVPFLVRQELRRYRDIDICHLLDVDANHAVPCHTTNHHLVGVRNIKIKSKRFPYLRFARRKLLKRYVLTIKIAKHDGNYPLRSVNVRIVVVHDIEFHRTTCPLLKYTGQMDTPFAPSRYLV